jgi:hypothetical protein
MCACCRHRGLGIVPALAQQSDQPAITSYSRATGLRIVPPDESALTDAERDAIGNPPVGRPILEVLSTCARNPPLCKIWLPFAHFHRDATNAAVAARAGDADIANHMAQR